MYFRLLGPVEVHSSAEVPVPLGGPKRVHLLAVLLTEPGTRFPVGRLIDELWPVDPPRSAAANLKTHVWALRRALLAPSHAPLIDGGAGGYRLVLAPDRLDAEVFAGLRRDGFDALRRGDQPSALATFERALALWRGDAFQGLPATGALQVAAARLHDQRRALVEEVADLYLAAGRHHELIDRLRAHIAVEPLRERPWGQLMSALARAGRQVDALAAYRHLREHLAEEVGVEPSREIQALHAQILRGDGPDGRPVASEAGLRAATPEPPRDATRPVPRQLPADNAHFGGRAALLAGLVAAVAAGGRPSGAPAITTITGAGGIGKTAFAVRYAHLVADRFPDGQFFADLRGYSAGPAETPAAVLRGFLQALGVEAGALPLDAGELIGLYRSLTAGRSVLVVLDNAASAAQVRPLLPASAAAAVVVTSRDRLTGLAIYDGASRLTLHPLTVAESVAVLRSILGVERASTEPDALARLATLCAGSPLALRIAATHLLNDPYRSVADLAAELAGGQRLALLRDADDPHTAVAAAFDISYQRLTGAQRRLFRLLGAAPVLDVDERAAAALAGLTGSEVRRCLDRLVAAHLVERLAAGRYRLHDLLQEYAIMQPHDDPGEPRASVRRLLDWLLGETIAAVSIACPPLTRLPAERLPPGVAPGTFADARAAAAWLDAERSNLVTAVRRTAAGGPHRYAWLLGDALRGYLFSRRHLADWAETAELVLRAAEEHGDAWALATAQLNMATVLACSNQPARALTGYRSALTHTRALGWDEGSCAALGSLGNIYILVGQTAQAARTQAEAVRLSEATGDLSRVAMSRLQLGYSYGHLGRLAESVAEFTRVRALAQQTGNIGLQALADVSLGHSYQLLDDADRAHEHLAAGLSRCRSIGDRHGEASALQGLAEAYRSRGQHGQAAEAAAQALGIATLTGDLTIEALVRSAFPREPDDRPTALRQARAAGDRYVEAWVLIELAEERLRQQRSQEAARLAITAATIARACEYQLLEGRALTALAATRLRQDRLGEARACARASLSAHRRTGHRRGERESLVILERCIS